MTQTYFLHTTVPDVRMKICAKTIVFEQQKTDGAWKYYAKVKLPLAQTHAEAIRVKYNLSDDDMTHLV